MQIIKTVSIDYKDYLNAREVAAIEHEASIMETREAAGIEALKIVQLGRGWISDDSLYAIAELLNMPVAELEGVATFYNLIYRQPVGQYVIHICDSISCYLGGYQSLLNAVKNHLGIDYGQTTSDGRFTLLSNVCLGGCDKAPVMMIAGQHYQQLTAQNALDILTRLASVPAGGDQSSSALATSSPTRSDNGEQMSLSKKDLANLGLIDAELSDE